MGTLPGSFAEVWPPEHSCVPVVEGTPLSQAGCMHQQLNPLRLEKGAEMELVRTE